MNQLMNRSGLFDDLFRDVAPGFFIKPLHGDAMPTHIKVEVRETPQAYTLQAEVPGVKKEDIHVQVDGNVVTLRAEVRQQDSLADGEKVLRSERFYGEVSRSFQMAQDIDNANSKARYDNGVLILTLPKKLAPSGQRLVIE